MGEPIPEAGETLMASGPSLPSFEFFEKSYLSNGSLTPPLGVMIT